MATRRFTWEDEDEQAARMARARLEAWGAKRRAELVGGAGSVPAASDVPGSSTVGAGGTGRPGDMPSVVLAAIDVENSLRSWGPCDLLGRVLDAVYVHGITEEPKELEYVFASGESLKFSLDAVTERGWKPPKAYVHVRHIGVKTRYQYDLCRILDVRLDLAIARAYPTPGQARTGAKRAFLEQLRSDFAGHVAHEAGFGRYAAVGRRGALRT